MRKSKTKIAIAYDFDGTLAPGNMQEHSFIPSLKINKKVFWAEVKKMAKDNDMDEILAYMQLMLQKAKEKDIPVRKKDFVNYGKAITMFNGVEDYFKRINDYALSKNIIVEHYIISSGLREFVKGTKISRFFTDIFASGFKYDANGVAEWPALAINYTNKTQYLFRISKGIHNSFDNSTINKSLPENNRPVLFSNMIYIGDGETDVPAMKMTKYKGGTAIAVYNPKIKGTKSKKSPKQICEDLIKQNRADYIAPADYSLGSQLDLTLKLLIDKISTETELKKHSL